jgi:phosphoribosylformimino-5-aminoimidazole carboxamide ribotide isomerase
MQIYPAIDLRGGKCVRLRRGDYSQETVFGDDPAAVARHWAGQGATYLHLVDLDGAKAGHPVNGDAVRRIVAAAGVPCQLGGGIRELEHVREVFSWGVARVILGTRALRDPEWAARVAGEFPKRVVVGIDANGGKVATDGWLNVSDRTAVELARTAAKWPIAAIVYTDISKDGMLEGPNAEATAELARAVDVPVIASGGVTTLDDVRTIMRLNLSGCIIGRALYEGRLDLTTVLAMSSGRGSAM